MNKQTERDLKIKYIYDLCEKLMRQQNIKRKDLFYKIIKSIQISNKISKKQLNFLLYFMEHDLRKQKKDINKYFADVTVPEKTEFATLPI